MPRTIRDPKNQNARKPHVSGCSRDFGTFRITDSCHTEKSKKIRLTRFGKNWVLSGLVQIEISDDAAALLPVAPYYIVVVSYPDNMKVEELELELPMHGMLLQSTQARIWSGSNSAFERSNCMCGTIVRATFLGNTRFGTIIWQHLLISRKFSLSARGHFCRKRR